MVNFIVIVESADNNYSAYLPDVPGCISTGSTLEETLQNIKEALEFHLESLAEEKTKMPQTESLEKHLSKGDIILDDDIIIANIHVQLPYEHYA